MAEDLKEKIAEFACLQTQQLRLAPFQSLPEESRVSESSHGDLRQPRVFVSLRFFQNRSCSDWETCEQQAR